MATSKVERLVNLVIALLSTRGYISAEKIRSSVAGYSDSPSAEAFSRMFERDKNELRDLGIPLEVGRASAWDPTEGYRINRDAYSLAPVDLTPDEAAGALAQTADFVLIGPGQPDVIRQALAYVRPSGTALLFAPTPAGVTTALDLGELYFREVSLVPSYSCGPTDTRQAYELLRQGRVRPERLITQRFELARVQEAYDTARRGGPAIKVLVTLDSQVPS